MGLEISEEFRPITPIRTVSRTCSNSTTSSSIGTKFCEAKEADAKKILSFDEDQESSNPSTPKSPTHILKSPLVCPPAPRKPRPPKRKLSPPPQGFFEIPVNDSDSVLVVLTACHSKKMRAT